MVERMVERMERMERDEDTNVDVTVADFTSKPPGHWDLNNMRLFMEGKQ